MKSLTSILILLLITGCATDDLPPDTTAPATAFAKKANSSAAAANPFDFTGPVYQELLDTYYQLPDTTGNLTLVIARAEAIGMQNKAFRSMLDDAGYRHLAPLDIAPYLNGGTTDELLTNQYSSHARGILSDMAAELDQMKAKDLPYQDVAAFFRISDGDILADPQLTAAERDAMLATTAIITNALDHDRKRRRRDRDWEWMTTHFAATANAAMESVPQAIMMSLVTDVY